MTLPKTMKAMVTTQHGDFDQIVLHNDRSHPEQAGGAALIRRVRTKICGAQVRPNKDALCAPVAL